MTEYNNDIIVEEISAILDADGEIIEDYSNKNKSRKQNKFKDFTFKINTNFTSNKFALFALLIITLILLVVLFIIAIPVIIITFISQKVIFALNNLLNKSKHNKN